MDMAPSTIQEKGQRSSLIALDHVVPFIARRSVVPSLVWAGTRNRGSNVAISTALALPCPPELSSHEYGNNGESFYQRRPLKTSCGFHPDIQHHCRPSDSISLRNGFQNQVRLFLRQERILQRPLLFVKGAFMASAVHPC